MACFCSQSIKEQLLMGCNRYLDKEMFKKQSINRSIVPSVPFLNGQSGGLLYL